MLTTNLQSIKFHKQYCLVKSSNITHRPYFRIYQYQNSPIHKKCIFR